MPARPSACDDLDETPGVRARVDVGARREDVTCLAVAELACRLRLDDVVDPGRAAAEILLGGLDDRQAWDPLEQRLPGGGQSLGVPEVARVLVGDRELERREAGQLRLAQRLGDVDRGELAVLEVGAAPGRVHDDRVDAVEAPAQALRQPRGLLGPAGVGGERAATALGGGDDLVAGRGEDARGRRVDVAEADRLDAAGEQADATRRLCYLNTCER